MKTSHCRRLKYAAIAGLILLLSVALVQLIRGFSDLFAYVPALLWYLGVFLLLAGALGFITTLALVYFPCQGKDQLDECT